MPTMTAPHLQEIRTEYQAFARAKIAKRAPALYERGEFDMESWHELCAMGMWRLPVPRDYGGAGLTWWEFVAAFEGLATASRDLGFLLSLVAHCGLIRAMMEFGTEAQRARYLPDLMKGKIGATAMTEPTGGSDVARLKTQAVRHGEGYVVNGCKQHITNAPIADLVLVLGRIPELGARDITLFLLEKGATGFSAGEAEEMFGNRTSPTGPLLFENLQVSAEQVVGVPGDGLETVYNIISMDRLLYGIMAAGYLEPLLTDAMRYAQERVAFKAPIVDHEYIQGRLTDVKIAIESVRWVSYAALDYLVRRDPQASAMCSIAKYQGAEALCQGTQHIMHIFGHIGYMEGSLAKDVRDALGTRIAGGTTEMQRKNIMNQMLKLAKRGDDAGCLASISD